MKNLFLLSCVVFLMASCTKESKVTDTAGLNAHFTEGIRGDRTFSGTDCASPAGNCLDDVVITSSSLIDLFDDLDNAITAEDVGDFVVDNETEFIEMFPDLNAVDREYLMAEVWTADVYVNTSSGLSYYKFGDDPANGDFEVVVPVDIQ